MGTPGDGRGSGWPYRVGVLYVGVSRRVIMRLECTIIAGEKGHGSLGILLVAVKIILGFFRAHWPLTLHVVSLGSHITLNWRLLWVTCQKDLGPLSKAPCTRCLFTPVTSCVRWESSRRQVSAMTVLPLTLPPTPVCGGRMQRGLGWDAVGMGVSQHCTSSSCEPTKVSH